MNYYDLIYINNSKCFLIVKESFLIIIDMILFSNNLILKTEFCGKRDLSYKIKNNTSGYYIIISFSSRSDFLKNLTSFLKKDKFIIRFLILNLNKDNFISTFFLNRIINNKSNQYEKKIKSFKVKKK